jgi:hypothetical protein
MADGTALAYQAAKGHRPSFRTEKKSYPQSGSFRALDIGDDEAGEGRSEKADSLSDMPPPISSPFSALKKSTSLLGIGRSPGNASRKTLRQSTSQKGLTASPRASQKGLVDNARRGSRRKQTDGSDSGFASPKPRASVVAKPKSKTAMKCVIEDCQQTHRYADGYCHLHRKLATTGMDDWKRESGLTRTDSSSSIGK